MEISKKFLAKMIIIIILTVLCVFQAFYHIVTLFGGNIHDKHLIVGQEDVSTVIDYLNNNSPKYVSDCGANSSAIKPYLVKKTTEKQGKAEKTVLTVNCQRGFEYKFYTEGSSLEGYINTHGSNTILHLVFVLIINAAFIAFFVFLAKKVYVSEFDSFNRLKAKEVKE